MPRTSLTSISCWFQSGTKSTACRKMSHRLPSSYFRLFFFSPCYNDNSWTAAVSLMKFCTNVYLDNLQKPIEYQGHRSRSHGFFCVFCRHDTRGQCLALSDVFTCSTQRIEVMKVVLTFVSFTGFPRLLESPGFFGWKFQDLENPGESLRSWNVLENVLEIRALFWRFKWKTSSNSTAPRLCWLLLTSGSEKVLENFSWGCWKVLEKSWIFFVSQWVGTLRLSISPVAACSFLLRVDSVRLIRVGCVYIACSQRSRDGADSVSPTLCNALTLCPWLDSD